MSDNLHGYRAIRVALIQYYPGEPTGTVARHSTTLAALISGMVASKSTQLSKIATHVPDGRKPESRVLISQMIFINHSCDAYMGVQGHIVFIAMRDIQAGAELTHD
jgi:SET domain-containing protein